MLRIHLILMRILDPHWKKWIRIRIQIQVISVRFTDLIFFSLIFILKLFLVDILPLGSEDPHIFSDPDPDPESQNLADPTDPDPKQC